MNSSKFIATRSILSALLVLIAPSLLFAQSTEAGLRALLVDKQLYLRGQWSGDKLAFDDAGRLQQTASPTSFTLAGVEISSVKLSSKHLDLEGQRVGLVFTKDVPERIGLVLRDHFGSSSPERISIRIQTPANGDFTTVLDEVFADRIEGLTTPMPEYWRKFAQQHLLPAVAAPADSRESPPDAAKMPKIGGSVVAPQLLTHVEPQFSGPARSMKFSGAVLLSLIVQTNGIPTQICILRPVGLGLDEQAVLAVSQYTFKPAMQGDAPVPVMLNIEVNFQVF